MTFAIAYEGDDQDLLVTFLTALLAKSGGEWAVEVETREGKDTYTGRLQAATEEHLVLLDLDPEAGYEPFPDGRTTRFDVDDVYRVVIP